MGVFGAIGKAIKKSAGVVNRAVTKPGSNPFKSAPKKEPIASLRTAGAASAPSSPGTFVEKGEGPMAKVARPSMGKQQGASLDLGKKRKSFGSM